MRIKSNFTLFMLILFLSFPAVNQVFAAENEYNTVAENFLKYLNSDKEIISYKIIETNALDSTSAKIAIAYLADLEGGGYIIVSASKCLTPVKAYSLRHDFATLPDPYKQFLLFEMEYNIRTITTSGRTPNSVTAGETQKRWDFLLNFKKARSTLAYTPDTYLLTAQWNQNYPYNKFLPEINDDHVFAGCTNIALAQVMKFHNHPSTGTGVALDEWNDEELKAILYRTYNWENMPDVLDEMQPEYKVDEVALLIRDLGIVNQTAFGTDSSPASIHTDVLIENFGYSNSITSMDNSDATSFFSTLKCEIDAERPVLLSFRGCHMTVADGYSSDPSGKKFHVNMGWGGHYDDYYFLDDTVQAGDNTYPPDLKIYYNIKPCDETDCWTNLESNDNVDSLNITGEFDNDQDADKYELYLKGNTTITGERTGYGNQAFFISIYDSSRAMIVSSDQEISQNLPAGRYTVRISLCSETKTCYTYDASNAGYTACISTDVLTEAEKTAIDNSMDIQPVINNNFQDILLNSSNPEPYKILIDARDENGDPISLRFANSNAAAVQVSLSGNVLSLSAGADALNIASTVTIIATANGKSTEKSFVVMVSDEEISFGKSFEVRGLFESQKDFNTHRVILDGNCTVKGDRGYSNQCFYSSVLDTDQYAIVTPDDAMITGNFSKNIYLLGASLSENPEGTGSYYPYDANANYTLSVSCPEADDQTSAVAALLGIDLSSAATPEITYNPATLTNQDVVATIMLSDGSVTSDGGATHTFIENGIWTFEFTDAVGNTGTAVATVNWVDKTAPTAIINAPTGVVNYQTASITVNGTDVIHYKYKLDDEGAYSSVIESSQTIEFKDLFEGSHTLYVIGCDSVGNWQSEASATTASWDIHIVIPSDVNDDGDINLTDAILSLQSTIGVETPTVNDTADVNGDGKIGLEEVIYILQKISELRQ